MRSFRRSSIALGAHVSEAPHQQTIRDTPLTTRFNVAAFGCLGYELDLKYLTRVQKKEIKSQIAFYKEHRKIFQFGHFIRGEMHKDNKVVWHCMDKSGTNGASGFFQTLTSASEGYDCLELMELDREKKYVVKTRPQSIFISRFGGLVKHIMPVTLNPHGFLLPELSGKSC